MQEWLNVLPHGLLVFIRISAFFLTAPIFSSRLFPVQAKTGMTFFVALTVAMTIDLTPDITFDSAYILLGVQEALVGILLGYTATLFFMVIQISGAFIDIQMGFGIAQVFDPVSGVSSPLLGNFKYYIALLLFLAMHGHHYLLMAIMDSYEWIPLDQNVFGAFARGSFNEFMIRTMGQLFVIALQLAAPIVVSLFLVDVGLGLLARTAPQFNIFVIGLPIKIAVGFMIVLITIPGYVYLFDKLFQTLFQALEQVVGLIIS